MVVAGREVEGDEAAALEVERPSALSEQLVDRKGDALGLKALPCFDPAELRHVSIDRAHHPVVKNSAKVG